MGSFVASSKCHSASGASAAAAIVPRSISGARLNKKNYKGQIKKHGGMERSKYSVVVKAAKSQAPEEPIVSPTQGEVRITMTILAGVFNVGTNENYLNTGFMSPNCSLSGSLWWPVRNSSSTTYKMRLLLSSCEN